MSICPWVGKSQAPTTLLKICLTSTVRCSLPEPTCWSNPIPSTYSTTVLHPSDVWDGVFKLSHGLLVESQLSEYHGQYYLHTIKPFRVQNLGSDKKSPIIMHVCLSKTLGSKTLLILLTNKQARKLCRSDSYLRNYQRLTGNVIASKKRKQSMTW